MSQDARCGIYPSYFPLGDFCVSLTKSTYYYIQIVQFVQSFTSFRLHFDLCPSIWIGQSLCTQSSSPWSKSLHSQMLSFPVETLCSYPFTVPMSKSKSPSGDFQNLLSRNHCVFPQPFLPSSLSPSNSEVYFSSLVVFTFLHLSSWLPFQHMVSLWIR